MCFTRSYKCMKMLTSFELKTAIDIKFIVNVDTA
jgi:hypothetical protein